MARADQLKKLFSSFSFGDRELFIKTANEIIADERNKGHGLFASSLERALKSADVARESSLCEMKSLTSSRNEDDDGSLVEIVFPDKYFEDIVLPEEKLQQLKSVVKEFQNWDVLISNGVAPVSRLLFYGPPGCGKTLSAHALAAEIGVPLMYVRFDALISSYLGKTAGNIRKVFELANRGSYVIFFDEFDAIGRSREDSNEHGEIKRVVNTFLQQIDGFKGRSVVIAATNFEQSLDYAIWRRFDETVRFELPTTEEKRKLFSLKLKQFQGPLDEFDIYSYKTENFSYADIENICRTIMRTCILKGTRFFTRDDVRFAVFKQKQLVSIREKHTRC